MLLYQKDAELLFPSRIIADLQNLRGKEFQTLIEEISNCNSDSDLEVLGFSLMMIRLAHCMTCTADSYRAMRGCSYCASKVVRSFRGEDSELIQSWQKACQEVRQWQESGLVPADF